MSLSRIHKEKNIQFLFTFLVGAFIIMLLAVFTQSSLPAKFSIENEKSSAEKIVSKPSNDNIYQYCLGKYRDSSQKQKMCLEIFSEE